LDKTTAGLKNLLEVAGGKRETELYIDGGTLVNVFTGELYQANVAVEQGKIAYVGDSRSMVGTNTKVIDASGYYLCPGFIEPHTHPWLVCNPVKMVEAALPLGNTAFVCDSLFLFAYLGAEGLLNLINALADLPAELFWVARIMHQSPVPEEQEYFSLENLDLVFSHPRVIKVGEITRWPRLFAGDESILAKMDLARVRRLGFEGHTAGCSYDRLNALVASGLESCHEAITVDEVIQRLRLGLWTMLRHSSLRPDLPTLLKAVTEKKVQTGRLMFTTDGSIPNFLRRSGFIGGMMKLAVAEGLDPVTAIQMATINPAAYLGLEQKLGGIAPGWQADLLLLPDLQNFKPHLVLTKGQIAAIDGKICAPLPGPDWGQLGLRTQLPPLELVSDPSLYGIKAHETTVFPVIELVSAAITKLRETPINVSDGFLAAAGDLLHCSLVNRHGRWVTNGFLTGFGKMDGLATNFATSNDLLVLGRDRNAMARAAAEVVQMGGGIVIIHEGKILFKMRLEYGLMNGCSFDQTADQTEELDRAAAVSGYPFNDVLYTLLFMVCDFLPGFRITARGIYDVKTRQVLAPVTLL